MWTNPANQENVKKLKERKINIIGPNYYGRTKLFADGLQQYKFPNIGTYSLSDTFGSYDISFDETQYSIKQSDIIIESGYNFAVVNTCQWSLKQVEQDIFKIDLVNQEFCTQEAFEINPTINFGDGSAEITVQTDKLCNRFDST